MTIAVSPTALRGRLATWFGAASQPESDLPVAIATEADTRLLVERRLFEEVGDFLFKHRLSPTPINYEVAHAYLTGSDPQIVRAVGKMLADKVAIDSDSVGALLNAASRDAGGAGALASLAGQLESHLAECLHAADRTRSSAREYGDALDRAQVELKADPAGTLHHIAGLTREVVSTTRLVESELKETRREAQRLRSDLEQARDAAERDHLTGLPNRRGFERRAERTIAEQAASGSPTTRAVIALCDIDDFKRVNDVHGHQAGDRVLKFVASFLSGQLSNVGYVARHGGEEFAILIEGVSTHEAMLLLDDVRDALAARSLVNQETGQPIGRVTFSAGIAVLDGDVVGALAIADAALYDAKHNGKNGVAIAPTMPRVQAKQGAGGRPSI